MGDGIRGWDLPPGKKKIHVHDIDGPTAQLCWKQDPMTMARCDRRKHSAAVKHTWELAEELPVRYYDEGGVTYAVYGSSSIDYVEKLRTDAERVKDRMAMLERERDAVVRDMLRRRMEMGK